MSITTTKPATDVTYKLARVNIRSINDKENATIEADLVSDDGKKKIFLEADVFGNFSADEKSAAKTFLKAIEREAALADSELAGETHDDSDVFA